MKTGYVLYILPVDFDPKVHALGNDLTGHIADFVPLTPSPSRFQIFGLYKKGHWYWGFIWTPND